MRFLKTKLFDNPDDCDQYANRMFQAEHFSDKWVGGAPSSYKLFDDLMDTTKPLIEKLVSKKLWATYSYARIYTKGNFMEPHVDRDACEYSASINLGFKSNSPYPIFFDGEEIIAEKNEMVVYKGREVLHWRDIWDCDEGDWQVQVFLHYVDQDGPYASEKGDPKNSVKKTLDSLK